MNRFDLLLGKKYEKNFYAKRRSQDLSEGKSFRQEYYGAFVGLTCSVSDGQGNRCPGKPVHFIGKKNNEEIVLCERCYDNYQRAAFDYRIMVQFN